MNDNYGQCALASCMAITTSMPNSVAQVLSLLPPKLFFNNNSGTLQLAIKLLCKNTNMIVTELRVSAFQFYIHTTFHYFLNTLRDFFQSH